MITTIISLVDRTEARNLTIPQFQALCIKPQVILSDPTKDGRAYGNPRSNLAAARLALAAAIEAEADLLFCEDDIDLNPRTFLQAVEIAREVDEVTYLYVHDDPKRLVTHYRSDLANHIRRGGTMPLQAVKLRSPRELDNTQCVYLPHRYLSDLLERHGKASFDVHLWTALAAWHIRPWVVLPHPVQHRNDLTMRDPARHTRPHEARRSLTFERGFDLA